MSSVALYSFSRVLAICIRFKRLKFSAQCLRPFALPPSGIQNEHRWRAMSCRFAFLLSKFCDLDIQKLCSFLPMSAAFAVSVQRISLWNTINEFPRSPFSNSCRTVSGGCGRHSHSEIPPFLRDRSSQINNYSYRIIELLSSRALPQLPRCPAALHFAAAFHFATWPARAWRLYLLSVARPHNLLFFSYRKSKKLKH